MNQFDTLVIGGGINGCGVAALAASVGYKLALCEQADFGSGTSSASSKMVHGGLRYLEQGRIGLVAESLHERAALQRLAPHLVRPLPVVLPVGDGGRPLWLLRIGLFGYDWLSRGGQLPRSAAITLGDEFPLRRDYRRGIRYWDCQVDDARLVLTNALAAAEDGATVMNYTRCTGAKPHDGGWQVTLQDASGVTRQLQCKVLINAAGPWVNLVDDVLVPGNTLPRVRLVKGSHLVLKRIYPGDDAFLLQHTDGRVIFCIPWLDDYTLLGTTDVDYEGDPALVAIDDNEAGYLKAVFQDYFGRAIADEDIVSTFAGIRALVDDGKVDPRKASRESKVSTSHHDGSALISLYGGKLTTYRALARQCVKLLGECVPAQQRPRVRPLPGGAIDSLEALRAQLAAQYGWLPDKLQRRLSANYGSRVFDLLAGVNSEHDLGEHFGHGLYAHEVDWLVATEWACNTDDILWRRSKLGLVFDANQRRSLERYLERNA